MDEVIIPGISIAVLMLLALFWLWGIGLLTGTCRRISNWWHVPYKREYDFDKNPPKSLFVAPELSSKQKVKCEEEALASKLPLVEHWGGEDVEWVTTRHVTGRPMFPENQTLYNEVFAKRGARWVKQKR